MFGRQPYSECVFSQENVKYLCFIIRTSVLTMWIAISFSNLVPKRAQCRTAGCGVCMGAAALPSFAGQCWDQPVPACPSKTHIRTIPTKEFAQAEPAGRDTSPRCAV